MEIRAATLGDLEAILPLVGKTCAFHEAMDPAKYGFLPNPSDRYRRWLTGRVSDAASVVLVAEREGRIVGFVLAMAEDEIPIYRVKRFGFVHDLWVEEQYRNEGIARQMVSLLVERFREMGVDQVRCDVLFGNEPARNLFAACGFRPTTVEMMIDVKKADGE
jgi:ribosomal protein S18 acetylase RimI-like enzyme